MNAPLFGTGGLYAAIIIGLLWGLAQIGYAVYSSIKARKKQRTQN